VYIFKWWELFFLNVVPPHWESITNRTPYFVAVQGQPSTLDGLSWLCAKVERAFVIPTWRGIDHTIWQTRPSRRPRTKTLCSWLRAWYFGFRSGPVCSFQFQFSTCGSCGSKGGPLIYGQLGAPANQRHLHADRS